MNERLLPPSAPPFLHHTEKGGQRLTALPVLINTLWDPDTCPAHLLPWLAWALSVDRWDESWSEEARRQIIRDSWLIHRHKGTISAMRRAVEPFGAILSITEWWENNDPPGSFRLDIDISERGLTEETRLEMERMIATVRPVSRHLAAMKMTYVARGISHIASTTLTGDTVTVYPAAELTNPLSTDSHIYPGGVTYEGVTVTIKPDKGNE
ncbi:phage tail protein I [Escherichia coli]|nr:phage tail protein I [Escherichia coli]EJN3773876.1 phage tail protein I [Escherichia coli]EJN4321756.1 phage tail protein I [Escherichia coli]EJN4385029.1 phage tail protein I [Escherichia coli]EJN4419020.1 phage tail protein I [Escherichia coli]